ncbi:MAG: hypothetical protein ABIO94_08800, partial [Opitutaceae bacterium]
FVILNEVKNPRFRRHSTRGFFAPLRMTSAGLMFIAMTDLGKFIVRYTQFALADCSVSQNDRERSLKTTY